MFNLTVVELMLICDILISLLIAISVGTVVYNKVKKRYEEKIGYLESRVYMLEEHVMHLTDDYKEHIGRCH